MMPLYVIDEASEWPSEETIRKLMAARRVVLWRKPAAHTPTTAPTSTPPRDGDAEGREGEAI